MYAAAARLRQAVAAATPRLAALTPAAASLRPAPDKWCPAEIIGHLIDSATNNHRRFVLGQLQNDLVFPGYDQDAWVRVQRHRDVPWEELVASWRALNLHLAHVLEAAGEPERTRPRHVVTGCTAAPGKMRADADRDRRRLSIRSAARCESVRV